MKRVLITGARGLVGSSLQRLLEERSVPFRALDMPECDVTRPERIASAAREFRPDWIVNLAAFTAVDRCETEPERAFAANAEGARNVALVAADLGCPLLHISTEYVFDGAKDAPYSENDEPHPVSVYGESKLRGERAVKEVLGDRGCLVVRGQSLFGAGRKSFPHAIARALEVRDEVPVVTDQIVSPTWAREFAFGLVELMVRDLRGIYHLSSSGSCTWNEFARTVAVACGASPGRITATTAADLDRPARRPRNSVFDLSKFARDAGYHPSTWREQWNAYSRTAWRAA